MPSSTACWATIARSLRAGSSSRPSNGVSGPTWRSGRWRGSRGVPASSQPSRPSSAQPRIRGTWCSTASARPVRPHRPGRDRDLSLDRPRGLDRRDGPALASRVGPRSRAGAGAAPANVPRRIPGRPRTSLRSRSLWHAEAGSVAMPQGLNGCGPAASCRLPIRDSPALPRARAGRSALVCDLLAPRPAERHCFPPSRCRAPAAGWCGLTGLSHATRSPRDPLTPGTNKP